MLRGPDVQDVSTLIGFGIYFYEAARHAQMHALFTPNDPLYTQQWHYYQATGGLNLPPALDISNGSGVTVAVIDSGILSHGDLNANIVAGYDLGMFRLEGEVAYKRTTNKSIGLDDTFVTTFNAGAGTSLTSDDFDLGGIGVVEVQVR